ncbi:MAG: dephospho-CoA kinase [Actinobacteria bacterium]|nr:dephospho-CoA kinase [Actinomycetota bacterium]MCL5446416.1 dephospho-CoA kinase [Actinomycetota bacterium]
MIPVLAVGLSGGIGSGKSTVARALASRGATIVDADLIAREVCRPGMPAFDALVAEFGTGILSGDGEVDRKKLASLVFGNREMLDALNAITHPEIGAVLIGRREALDHTGGVGVFDIPLLSADHKKILRLDVVVVVDCPGEVAVSRIMSARSMTREEAEARLAAQISRTERLSLADYVLDNSGTVDRLSREVERLWHWLLQWSR